MIRRVLAIAAATLGALALIAGTCHPDGGNLTRRSAGVPAGWPGVRPAAYPPDSDILPSTAAARTRAEPAGGDASAPAASIAKDGEGTQVTRNRPEPRNLNAVSAGAANLEILRPRSAGLRMTNRQPTQITAVELAEWIRDRKPNLRIIDTRPEAAFDEYHLPRAERADSLAAAQFKSNETVVLVSGAAVTNRDVYILRGGVKGWIDEVMNPTITADAPPSARAAYDRASIVSRYFGGVPRIVDKLPVTRSNVAAVRRRGC
jgi:rhodanese-related sulfurtransferase